MAYTRIRYTFSEYQDVDGDLDAIAAQVSAAKRAARLLKLKGPVWDPREFWYLNPDAIISLIEVEETGAGAATVIS